MRGNLADLAATGIASEPTLRKWVAAEPDQAWILKRGKNGDAYEIDLEGAVTAWRAREEQALQAARDRADSINQFAMDLGIRGSGNADALQLSVAERRQLLDEEIVAMRLGKLRGELVDRAAVENAFGDVLVKFRQQGQTFAARLAKKMDFSREQLAAIEKQTAADLELLATWLERMELGGEGDGGDSGEDPATALEAAAAAHG